MGTFEKPSEHPLVLVRPLNAINAVNLAENKWQVHGYGLSWGLANVPM
jgi:hypothetical protein